MPTLALDTAPGTTLNVGETWRQNKMTMTVLNQRFSRASCDAIVEFTINLQNNDAIELTMDLRGSDWAVTDDQGREYSVVFNTKGSSQTDTCADYGPLDKLQQPFIASGQIITYALRVNGAFDDQVKAFVLTAKKAGRVQNAAWTIPIPPR